MFCNSVELLIQNRDYAFGIFLFFVLAFGILYVEPNPLKPNSLGLTAFLVIKIQSDEAKSWV